MPTKDSSSDWFSIDSVFVLYQMPWADWAGTFTLAAYDPGLPPAATINSILSSSLGTLTYASAYLCYSSDTVVSVTITGGLITDITGAIVTDILSPTNLVP